MEHATTNWKIAEGCLNESIYYDTTTDIDNLLEAQPLLLTKPDNDVDSPPCEISIYFREKHNIFRVYVRSTARVYEIYLSSNQQTSSEYLCTVHCEAVLGEASKNQIHYEATVDISNVHPCLSLAICLLPVQTATSVYIDEIYVYADPVEIRDSESSSIFSMHGCANFSKEAESNTFHNNLGLDHGRSEVNYHICSRIENSLNELIKKVDRVETYCSKLEEKLLKPLDSMGKKIQQLEQKLDSLAIKSESCGQCLCSRKDSDGSSGQIKANEDVVGAADPVHVTEVNELAIEDRDCSKDGSDEMVESLEFLNLYNSEDTFTMTFAESIKRGWEDALCDGKFTRDQNWRPY